MRKKIMEIPTDEDGRFVERKNRFLGIVDIGDGAGSRKEQVHVRDPGRLEEILYEGNEVALRRVENENRKTDWDLVAGKVGDDWVLVNSGYHRTISETVLNDDEIRPFNDFDSITPETRLGESVIDFMLERGEDKIWVEVKGCTLAEDGVALFPDAPTLRGKRHVDELRKAIGDGDSAALVILVFRPDAECFAPYEDRDPEFTDSFELALEEGLEVHPLRFEFEDNVLYYTGKIPLCRSL